MKGITNFFEEMGRLFLLLIDTIGWIFRPPLYGRLIFAQMEEVGINSMMVVSITGTFTGMILALQTYTSFQRFGAESILGGVVALSVTRELGPVLTALMVAGRAGSAMAAEIGTMRVTEQIDALTTMATNPVKYLIVPRFLAGLVMLPILTIYTDALGILGGYLVSVYLFGTNPTVYIQNTFTMLHISDITNGLIKAGVFGMSLTIIACYCGFYSEGGAEGVGRATNRSVVFASLSILILDFFLGKILF
ncbi:MAG: ABC transporter permease [Acidobacteria bacterium]|nr:ABC transporter permease [Acidobacteriota bacterium]